ncbi:MAG: aldehyde dehydrogenase family protein [Candidatus Melainabacteria bacterium]
MNATPTETSPSGERRVLMIREPLTGEIHSRVRCHNASDVSEALCGVRAAAGAIAGMPVSSRVRLLKRVAGHMAREQDSLAALVSADTGKPPAEALLGDIGPALGILDFTAAAAPGVLRTRLFPPDKSWLVGRIHSHRACPMGVAGVITPWNYPVGIAASSLAPALAAGNGILWKPSELTPRVNDWLYAAFRAAMAAEGLPEETLIMLSGDGETGEALVNASVDRLVFTGSTGVGRLVQRAAAAANIPCSLELGGSDPVILLPEVDPEAIADDLIWGRFVNAGQACAAVKKILAPEALMPALTQALLSRVATLQLASPGQPAYHIGPLISARHRQVVHDQVQASMAMGARVLCGGRSAEGPGYVYEPTVLTAVTPDMPVMSEEVFGPVLPLYAYRTVAEAVEVANAPGFGLGASVYGPLAAARGVAARLQAGTVMINDAGPVNYGFPSVPWHGWGRSGPGLSHGRAAIDQAARWQIETINLSSLLRRFLRQPWHFDRPPVSLRTVKPLVKAFMREGFFNKMDIRLITAMRR